MVTVRCRKILLLELKAWVVFSSFVSISVFLAEQAWQLREDFKTWIPSQYEATRFWWWRSRCPRINSIYCILYKYKQLYSTFLKGHMICVAIGSCFNFASIKHYQRANRAIHIYIYIYDVSWFSGPFPAGDLVCNAEARRSRSSWMLRGFTPFLLCSERIPSSFSPKHTDSRSF